MSDLWWAIGGTTFGVLTSWALIVWLAAGQDALSLRLKRLEDRERSSE